MSLGVRFEETMRGHLHPLDGAPPLAMSLSASVHAPRVLRLWRRIPMTLTGHMTLEGSATGAPTKGTISLEVRGLRRVIYDLSWRLDDGQLGRFYGWKTLSVRHFVRGWTELKGQVTQRGELMGQATLQFDLKDLPAFLRSMRAA